MGRMLVSAAGFGAMTEWVAQLADEVCDGRLVVSIEGGYSHLYTPFCVLAVFGALLGRVPELVDPFEGDAELRLSLGPASPAVDDAIEAVRRSQPRWFA